jgi:hypothetical protein
MIGVRYYKQSLVSVANISVFARVKYLVSVGSRIIISNPYRGKQCDASLFLWLTIWSNFKIKVCTLIFDRRILSH